MAQFYRYPASVSTNPSIGTIGAIIPTSATLVGFEDPNGDLAPGHVNAAGDVLVAQNSAEPGRSYVDSVITDYGTTNVTAAAWVQLIAALPADANVVEIFDSSGEIMELGVGAAAAESRVAVIQPGGNGQIQLAFAAWDRISIRAVSATASTSGTYNILNFFS